MIDWQNLPHKTDEGYEVTHHMYSDTYILRLNGRTIADELASMNSQGDMYIYWIENEWLHSSAYGKRTGEYGSHTEFKKIVERLSGQEFSTLLRR